MLGGIDQSKGGSAVTEVQLKSFLSEQKRQQNQERRLEVTHSEERELEINGAPAKFEIVEAKDKETGKEYRSVSGTFHGKSGIAGLLLEIPAEEFDEAAVEKLLESIK